MPDFKRVPTVNSTAVALGDHPHPADGLAMWYDAGQLDGLADGNAVATWPDLSGNERDLVQGTGANRPLYKTNVLTGNPVVRFDGTNDYLATAAFPAALAQPSTYVAVFRVATLGVFNTVFDGTSGARNFLSSYDSNTWTFFSGSTEIQGGTANTSWHVATALFNGAASVLRIDGTQVAAGNPGSNALGGLVLGIGVDLASGPFNGDMAELIVYNRALTLSERLQAEDDLLDKWGLQPGFGRFASLVRWGTD